MSVAKMQISVIFVSVFCLFVFLDCSIKDTLITFPSCTVGWFVV